jgi:putative ABC transport system permease protein
MTRIPNGVLFLTYLRFELRHRLRQAIFIAAGLAIGVGLVITVSAAAAGAKNAQASVLHELYGIGTDITVTRPYTHADAGPGYQVNAGTAYEFLDTNQGLYHSSAVKSVAGLPDVRAAVGVLALYESDIPANASININTGTLGTVTFVDGVDTADQELGPLSEARVIAGRDLNASDSGASVALVDSGYAKKHHLSLGSVIILAHHTFRVVGVVSQPAGTVPSVLIPIQVAQEVAHLPGQITTVYVAASSASEVSAVAKEIKSVLPWADVTTSASLAGEISGSLATTARLANDLGRWLAAAALVAGFILAALLTVAAVSRRVREFGTLKALGWRARRITVQVLGESAAVGLVGVAAGIGLGYAASALISWLASAQNATVAAAPGSSEPMGGVFGSGKSCPTCQAHSFSKQLPFTGTFNSAPVHFTAPVAIHVVLLAAALGLAGGLLAGTLGAWRAARLRPTVALAHVG